MSRMWAKNWWNIAEAVLVIGSLATVLPARGSTREACAQLDYVTRDPILPVPCCVYLLWYALIYTVSPWRMGTAEAHADPAIC